MNLNGKTALLTGATGGLGRAIAKALAAKGVTVIASSRKPEELEALIAELPGSGHRTLVSDLAEEGAAEKLIADAGEIDIFVANAALPASGYLDSFSSEEIQRAIRVNLEAPILQTQALLPALIAKGEGHIVYISSLAGKVASPGASMYNATKFGLRGFALAFRQDVAGSGVGTSVVLPGFVRDAGMFADSGASPPPGMGTATPEQVGSAVVTAIEQNKREIQVAPPQQRAGASLAHHFPKVAEAMASQGKKVSDQIAAGQGEKR